MVMDFVPKGVEHVKHGKEKPDPLAWLILLTVVVLSVQGYLAMLDGQYWYLADRRIGLDLDDIAWHDVTHVVKHSLYYVTITVSNCLGFLTLTVNVFDCYDAVHGDGIKVKHLQAKGG